MEKVIRARISADLKADFDAICAAKAINQSALIRKWIEEYVNNNREELGMTLTYEGKKYTLTQDAYIDGPHENPIYKAAAVDADGNEYVVTWRLVDGWQQMDDAELHCDWDSPASVERY